MNPCGEFEHDFEPLVMERNSHGILRFTSRYCRKCGMVTDDRKMAARLTRKLDEEAHNFEPKKAQKTS